MPESDYYGSHGIEFRNDLAGLNLTTVPKVLIESGNMINATDAALLTTPRFQRQLAGALARGDREVPAPVTVRLSQRLTSPGARPSAKGDHE